MVLSYRQKYSLPFWGLFRVAHTVPRLDPLPLSSRSTAEYNEVSCAWNGPVNAVLYREVESFIGLRRTEITLDTQVVTNWDYKYLLTPVLSYSELFNA